MKPQPVTNLEIAFGGDIGKLLPPYASLPDEFKRSNAWTKLVGEWFFNGLSNERWMQLEPKEGIDRAVALNHLRAIMGSFEPKHEHKTSGVAWLLSQWFTDTHKAAK